MLEDSSVLGNININRWELTYAPGVSVFPFFPVLSPGGCESVWVALLTVVLPVQVETCSCPLYSH